MKYNKNEVTGKMRDRIILQNVNRSRSLTGFASESWADVATIWAFAESKLPGSNETIIEGKNTAKNICDFTIRYISSITEESRVVWGDKLYQVKNLKVSHDRRFISFQGVFYDSYILTGVNVAASVNGIATTSANLKLIMSVIGQANAIASAIGELTVFQQGVVEVASSVKALGTVSANVTKVINIDSSVDANANISAPLTIAKNIQSIVDANANISADLKLSKILISSVNASATATSILDVVTQGIVSLDASVTATGTTTANLLRIATLASSPSTAANTSATATLTKVLEASATATANTDASAQLTIPVNASATATAETSANAQLSYTVNAAANATAQTSADAFITRIISANATAMAESSAEASFGVTFAANVNGTATVTNATIALAATMTASVTGQASVTGATLTTVDNVSASVSGAATTNATLDVASPFILDLYGNAAAAYSVRKLRSAYTGSALRVRRSSDNTEQDIGFSNNNLDESALTTFVGANNGFVVTWYDQTGNARNATISTAANQPQIVSSGTVIKVNNKPALTFDTTNDILTVPTSTAAFKFLHDGTKSFILNVLKYNNSGQKPLFGNNSGTTAQTGLCIYKSSSNSVTVLLTNSSGTNASSPIAYATSSQITTNSQTLLSIEIDASNATVANRAKVYFNNGSVNQGNTSTGTPSTNNASQNFQLSSYGDGGGGMDGNLQECIFWAIDQASNRTNIHNNVNSYYGIY